jgi:hypothetical protein
VPPDDAALNAAIDRFWDEMTQGCSAGAGEVDPLDVATIRHLHAFDDQPDPESAFTQRLREDLVHAHMHAHPLPGAQHAPAGPRPDDRSRQPRWSAWRGRRPSGPLATAALVLLTAVASLLIFEWQHRQREPSLSAVPLVLVSPPTAIAPAPEVSLKTVFGTTLPAEQVPTAGNLDFLLWHVSLAPHSQGPASAQAWTCCPGPQITHVVAGDLTLRVEGPLQVFRSAETTAGAAPAASVPPDTAVVLHAGDTAVFPHDVPAEYGNRGTHPVHLVGGGIFAGAVRNGPLGLPLLDHNEAYSLPPLAPGPVDATLVRVVLPPGAEVPAPDERALVLEVGAVGDADVAQRADRALLNIGTKEETIYVLTLTPTDAPRSTPTS